MDDADVERLGRLLIAEGLITQEEMDAALKAVRDPAAQKALGATAYIRGDELAAFLAMDYRVPELRTIPEALFDAAVVKMVPEAYIRRARVLPLLRGGEVTFVAAVELPDEVALQDLRARLKSKVKIVKVVAEEFERHLHRLHPVPKMPAAPPTTGATRPSSTAELQAVKVEIPAAERPFAPMPVPMAPGMPEPVLAVKLTPDEFARLSKLYGDPLIRRWEKTYASDEPIPATRVQ